MAASQCETDDLEFVSSESLQWWSPPQDAGVAYGSCRECGSSLFWRCDRSPGVVSVCAGPLDPPTGLQTEMNIWVDELSDYHRLDPDLPRFPRDSDGSVSLAGD